MTDNVILVPLMAATFLFWGFVVYLILQWRKMKYKNSLQHKLIDKFNTVPELAEFLQTEGGNKFLNQMATEKRGPQNSLLAAVSKGVILVSIGIAFLVTSPIMSGMVGNSWIFKGLGIFISILGGGFILSAFISYILSKKWGIIEK